MSFLIVSCSDRSPYRFPPVFSLKVNYTAKEKRRKHTFCFLMMVHHSFLYVLTQRIEGTLQIFNKRFSDHGRMDALNRAEYTIVLLSRQLPDWEELSGRTPSMCLDYHRVLEWLELLMINLCPGWSSQSNWSMWDPWETRLDWKCSLPVLTFFASLEVLNA